MVARALDQVVAALTTLATLVAKGVGGRTTSA